jgi:hypothetical protein
MMYYNHPLPGCTSTCQKARLPATKNEILQEMRLAGGTRYGESSFFPKNNPTPNHITQLGRCLFLLLYNASPLDFFWPDLRQKKAT